MSSPGAKPESVLCHSPHLVVEEFDDAVLLWDEQRSRLHQLNLVAAVVWEELDGRHTLAEICRRLADDLGGDDARIRADVLRLAETLLSEGLLQLADTRSARGGDVTDGRDADAHAAYASEHAGSQLAKPADRRFAG